MKAFLALATHFVTEEEEEMADRQRYLHRLQRWLRGNWDWYTDTGRY